MYAVIVCSLVGLSFVAAIVLGSFYTKHEISKDKFWIIAACIIAVCALFLPIMCRNMPMKEMFEQYRFILLFAFWLLGLIPSFFLVTIPVLLTLIFHMLCDLQSLFSSEEE